MAVPNEVQILLDKLLVAGWDNISDEDLLHEIFYANAYPEHATLPQERSQRLFDDILSELDIEDIEEGGLAGGEAYGIIRINDKYFKATWGVSTSGYVVTDGIQNRIVEVKPKVISKTIYEEG